MYTHVKEILSMAVESKTAVVGFVCMDYIMARAVVYGAQAANTPALVMLYPEHVAIQKTTGRVGYAEAVKELAGEVNVPIGLHQDHDYTIASLRKTMDAGFESIMMDGSLNDLDENIRLTAEVVREAHARNVLVEGEIGHVGLASNADNDKDDLFTKPDAAERFCRESGVDSLAVSIGNAHGEYKQTPHLDIARLESIKAVTDVPLVLHGGSGIPDDQLAVAFAKGIRKFNLGTDFLSRYFAAVREFVNENIENPDPVKIINMPEFVQAKIQPYVEDRLRTLCRF